MGGGGVASSSACFGMKPVSISPLLKLGRSRIMVW